MLHWYQYYINPSSFFASRQASNLWYYNFIYTWSHLILHKEYFILFYYFFFNVFKTYLNLKTYHRDKYLNRGVLKSVADVIKTIFQIYGVCPDGVISKSWYLTTKMYIQMSSTFHKSNNVCLQNNVLRIKSYKDAIARITFLYKSFDFNTFASEYEIIV